ncbi:MAG: 4'-phosphopantetheinyl transferase superfamily protein [Blastocatellia bacterium]|nr:4'-phosphopantetheinyl transferase superfamily protein [Blastocatellia bacterium]
MPPIFWLMQTQTNIPSSLNWLSPTETSKAAKFAFEKKRREWLLGRWTAKLAAVEAAEKTTFADYLPEPLLGIASTEQFCKIEIVNAPSGSPLLVSETLPNFYISISHRAERAICTVGNFPHGCDLELIEARSDQFIADYFTKPEQQFLTSCLEKAKYANLFWSAKESVMKSLQTGLSIDPRSIEVTLHDFNPSSDWQKLSMINLENRQRFSGWWRDFNPYLMTTAFPSDQITINKTDFF